MAAQSDPLMQKLIQQLQDADARTRQIAAGALRFHGERAVGAIPELTRLLADDDLKVRAEAQQALDRLRRSAA